MSPSSLAFFPEYTRLSVCFSNGVKMQVWLGAVHRRTGNNTTFRAADRSYLVTWMASFDDLPFKLFVCEVLIDKEDKLFL